MNQHLFKLQLRYVTGGLLLSPLLPLIYLQGKKILRYFKQHPVVPPTGETCGSLGNGPDTLNMLILGESTVEGIGVKTFEESLSAKLAETLLSQASMQVNWTAVGKSGVTAAYTAKHIVPALENLQQYDLVVLVLGANDSFALTSPFNWYRQIACIAQKFKKARPEVLIYLASLPPVGSFPALPQPTRWVLGLCNKLLSSTSKLLADSEQQLMYSKALFENRKHLLCQDGIHPSAEGYAQWADAIAAELLPRVLHFIPLTASLVLTEA